ncbi:MAG: phosphoglucosamine mutase [Deferribacteres bacterium]|nr:phosphoglucosamine mutase [candidate division KSB1 bacterium]MCB9502465.1 phosphoglucosamine mutase [Deferribacteres bacterium]
MARLMISVSGIRGIVGDGLSPEIVTQFAQAYGTYCEGKPVVIGWDARVSGEMVHRAFVAGLISVGCDVIDLGIAATPTVQMMTEKLDCAGGIIITASHNPIMWNGIKMLAPDGLFLDAEQGAKILEIRENKAFAFKSWDKLGKVTKYENSAAEHIEQVLALPYINPMQIRARKFKVVADCINGAGSVILPKLLGELGCECIILNGEPNGIFARTPEPVPENLTVVCQSVKQHGADLALVVDPDSDRLALISEKGEPLGEEYTIAVAGDYFLKHRQGKVVVNVSTSQALPDIAREYGCETEFTRVGEINVTKHMREVGAVFGGEGNGGVILPELHLGRDAIVGAALVLQHLSSANEKLSEIKARLPQYEIVKMKIELSENTDAKALLQVLTARYKNEQIDLTDGMKLIRNKSWVQVRASNTEPILRVMAEAQDRETALAMAEELRTVTEELEKNNH